MIAARSVHGLMRLLLAVLVIATLCWGLPQSVWADEGGIVATATPSVVGSPSPSPSVNNYIASDMPLNSTFYKAVLHYPNNVVRWELPKCKGRAYIFALIATALFLMFTWPLSSVEVLLVGREARLSGRAKARDANTPFLTATPVAGEVRVVTRQVIPASVAEAEGGASGGSQVELVPLLTGAHRIGGCEPLREENQTEVVSVEERPFGPTDNPLHLWKHNSLQSHFAVPLGDNLTAECGLNILETEQPLGEVLLQMIENVLRQSKGRLVVASCHLDHARLVRRLLGITTQSLEEQYSLIRVNSRQLEECMGRIWIPSGERFFMEDFLRQILKHRNSTNGLDGIYLDVTARFEIGAKPKILGLEDWCYQLHNTARMGNFAIFLICQASQIPTSWPYRRFRLGQPVSALKPSAEQGEASEDVSVSA